MNIIRKKLQAWFDLADAGQIAEGKEWYHNANIFVEELANKFDFGQVRVSAIISALSPGVQWNVNKRDAENFLEANSLGLDLPTVSVSAYSAQKRKAIKILELVDINIDSVCNILGPTAWKTINFHFNILNSGAGFKYVTVDRWIIRAAGLDFTNRSHLQRRKTYELIVDAIIKIAKSTTSLTAAQTQAIIWITIRDWDEAAPF